MSTTEAEAPDLYREALRAGRLMFQRCTHCGAAQLPERPECTSCLGDQLTWEQASGRGRLISWVVYHSSFNPADKRPLPYTVAFVALEEGPRVITNIVDCADPEALRIEQPVVMVIEQEAGLPIARFRPMD